MLALMRMDWTQNRRLFFYLVPIWMIWIGNLLAPLPEARILVGFMLAGALSLTVMMQNHTRPIDGWLCALPVSRSQIVLARYASALLACLIGLSIPFLVVGLMNLLHASFWKPQPMTEYAVGLSLDGGFLVVFILLFLPLYFRFGADKGIGILLAAVMGVCGLLFWRWGYQGLMERFLNLLLRLMDDAAFRAWNLAALGLLALISVMTACWAYPRQFRRG